MKPSDRPHLASLTPLLVVSNLQRSLEFYRDRLGFAEPSVWGDPPCFAMMQRSGFEIMLSVAEAADQVHPHGAFNVWDLYLRVTDLRAEIAALESNATPLAAGPRDTFYNMREIEVLDPDGHRICIGQDTGDEPLSSPVRYEGVLDTGSAKLRLVLQLAKVAEQYAARIDSPDQNATNLLVDKVTRDGARFEFEMIALGASYTGVFGADDAVIEGTWSQRGRSWPLSFRLG